MKNHYQFFFLSFLSFIIAAFSISIVTAQNSNFKLKADGKNNLKLTENNYQKLCFKNNISDFSFMNVKTEKGLFTELSSPDYATSMVIGNPKLPVLKKMIEVPVGATPKVKIVSYNVTEYNLSDYGILNPIIPSQPPVSKDIYAKKPEFKYNETVYSNNAYLSNDLASIDIIGFMRGVRLGRLNITPVQYNPVTNSIRVYNDLEVEITFENADEAQTIALKEKNYSIYFNAVYDKLLNYKPLQAKANLTQYPVKYVIVSPPAYQATLQPFVQWKTKKGFTVVEAYTNNPLVGSTTTSIKAYLQGLYNAGTVSDPAPSFVLLVGDVAQIPSFTGTTGGHVSDLYYCEYTGDFLPECYYGRFSANSVLELTPQIDKTLEYEQYLMPDPSFLNKVVMIAGQDGTYGPLHGDGQINYGTTYYFNPAHNLTSYTYLYAVSGSSAAAIIANVSEGVGFANYTAHGSSNGWADPAFSISDIAGLANAHKYPLMIGNCCLTSTFDGNCFGEELLRAADKGALGYIGGSNSTYWDEDYWWGVGNKTVSVNPTYSAVNLGSYDCTFHDQGEPFAEWFVTQGQMISAGNLAVTQAGGSDDYYWEIYHLMGDPSLMVYFSVPPVITATYNPIIPLGTTSFTVTTEPYAYVGITQSGVLHGAALADNLGIAVVPSTAFTTPGYAKIVVTKQNRAPKIDSVLVASPSGPYIVYTGHVVTDVAGNNNGLADFGENVQLNISLQNVGTASANGVNAVLSTTDPNVTITTANHSWGTIANGITSTQTNAYAFSVANNAPDQHSVPFSLAITDNAGGSWSGSFNVTLFAPAFGIGNITVSDPLPGGNNNGKLDPGETADIIIITSNTGHADAPGTIGTLSSASGFITLNNTTHNFGTMNQSTGGNAIFNVTVSGTATVGSAIPFSYTVSSGAYDAQLAFNLPVGMILEDWETGTFSNYPWIPDAVHPWVITTVDPYEGVDCAKSGAITDSENSDLSINVQLSSGDSVSFYKKVSSEPNYDFLKFFVDGTQQQQWAGEVAWSRSAQYINAGTHLLKWSYVKDYSMLGGQDAAWLDYISLPGTTTISSVNEIPVGENGALICYPNPTSDNTLINYVINHKGDVSIELYNSLGKKVRNLISTSNQAVGVYSVTLDARGLSDGIYYCVMNSANHIITQKLIITKK